MVRVRTPAYITSATRHTNVSGTLNKNETNNISQTNCSQAFIITILQKTPQTLGNIAQAIYNLRSSSTQKAAPLFHKNEHGIPQRLMRVEGRDTFYWGSGSLLQFIDVDTMQIGYPNDSGVFVHRTHEWIRKKIGMGKKRFDRFIKKLKDARYIDIEQKRKVKNGNIVSIAARKIVSASLIIDLLGLAAWKSLLRLREYMRKKAKPKNNKERQNVNEIGKMFKNVTNPLKGIKLDNPKANERSAIKEQDLINLAIDAYEKDSSKTRSEHMLMIREILKKKE